MSETNPLLAYLGCINPTPNTFVGGILVVEPSGLPVEFRYSEPVQPNKMQSILYGNTLTHHIKVEIIGENLIKSLETPYDALFVKDDILLNICAEQSQAKLFRLSETKNIPIGVAGNIKLQATNDFLFQATNESNPLRFLSNPNDVGFRDSEELKQSAFYKTLLLSSQSLNLVEPLERLDRILTTLWQDTLCSSVSVN